MPGVAALSAASALNCWLAAASTFDIPPGLLYAIAEVESSHRPDAIAHARNGTYSVGLMQINSSWFSSLRDMGIDAQLLYQPCVNVQIGAWILSQQIARYGYSWEAIGAYYAGPYDDESMHWKLRHYRVYARKVLTAWKLQASRSD